MKRTLWLLVFVFVSLTSSAQHGKYVGGDISLLPEYEKHNSAYLDADGKAIDDLLTWFVRECGWNSFRVRLFVNPTETGTSRTGVVQDLDYAVALGKRIKALGATFMLDFHYSDSWADPSYQTIPSAWKGNTSDEALASQLNQYTADCMQKLKAAGAEPDFVQIGNEISYGMLWRSAADKVYPSQDKSVRATQWSRLSKLLNAAAKAVRENSNAKIVVHIERTGKSTETVAFYKNISDVDFDVIGLSYYPFFQGYLSQLSTTLGSLSQNFPDKSVQIVETSYPFQYYPSDVAYTTTSLWAASADGQYQYVKDLLALLKNQSNVEGLYWWQPEEAGNGDDTDWDSGEGATVMGGWLTRGMWWCATSTNGHWPVNSSSGLVAKLMPEFLAEGANVGVPSDDLCDGNTSVYNLAGQKVARSYKGIVIRKGRKYVQR